MTWGFDSIYEVSDETRQKMSISAKNRFMMSIHPLLGKSRPDVTGNNNCMRNPDIRKKFLSKYIVIDNKDIITQVFDLPSFCKKQELVLNNMRCLARSGSSSIQGLKCLYYDISKRQQSWNKYLLKNYIFKVISPNGDITYYDKQSHITKRYNHSKYHISLVLNNKSDNHKGWVFSKCHPQESIDYIELSIYNLKHGNHLPT